MEGHSIKQLLENTIFSYITDTDKNFICEFTETMNQMGYTSNGKIVDGICYGRHMMIFRKMNVKSDRVYARLYFRDSGVVVRLFFSNVTDHSNYISLTPDYIKESFVGNRAQCNHCRGDICKFRKSYQIDGQDYDKCNGITFKFFEPSVERLPSYMELFLQFYPQKRLKQLYS